MEVSARSLDIKRKVITKLMNEGLYPYTKRYLGTFDNHFSTIGLLGMNEACLNAKWLRCTIGEQKGHDFSVKVLKHMRNRLSDFQERYKGALFNLEATPAESTSYRLAKHDKERFKDIITANESGGDCYYTNSTHLPVNYTDDIFEALSLQDELQELYTSGTIFHAFLGEKISDWRVAASLPERLRRISIAHLYDIATYSICSAHGYLSGEQWEYQYAKNKLRYIQELRGIIDQ